MVALSLVHASTRPHPWRRRVLLTVLALIVLWLAIGFLRAPSVASDYLASGSNVAGIGRSSLVAA